MSRMAAEVIMAKKPKPFGVGPVRVRATRGPRPGGAWYWRAEDHATRETVWTGWATATEARKLALEAASEHDGQVAGDMVVDLEDLMSAWVAHLEDTRPDLAESSMRSYRLTGRRIRDMVGQWRCDRFGQAELEQVRGVMLRVLAPRTVQMELDRIVAAWRWARKVAAVPDRHLERVRVRIPSTVKITPTPGEVAAVVRWLETPTYATPESRVTARWRGLAVRVLYATGMRVGELAKLTRDRVLVERLELEVRGKTGQRVVPVQRELMRRLVDHMASHERAELLGVSYHGVVNGVTKGLRAACEAVEVRPFSSHGLRRAAVDTLARAGVDIGTAADLLGHTPEIMLEHYRQVTGEDRRAAVARARLGALPDEDNVIPLTAGEGS